MKLEKLIATSSSSNEARAYSAFVPSEADLKLLSQAGSEVLRYMPSEAGACALMSAVYAARLQGLGLRPVHVVAGSLFVRGQRVFGDDRPFDGSRLFSASHADWDGHVWVMLGPYVADVSSFRTAYSGRSPPLLAALVREEFGKGRGLIIVRWSDAPKSGL